MTACSALIVYPAGRFVCRKIEDEIKEKKTPSHIYTQHQQPRVTVDPSLSLSLISAADDIFLNPPPLHTHTLNVICSAFDLPIRIG